VAVEDFGLVPGTDEVVQDGVAEHEHRFAGSDAVVVGAIGIVPGFLSWT
jgi:hypothetical protein